MKRIAIPLFAVVLLLGVAAAARAEVTRYTCEPMHFPDGTSGVAVVTVTIEPTAPGNIIVRVDYYSDGQAEHLGRYEDRTNNDTYPKNEDEARQFALTHFYDRW